MKRFLTSLKASLGSPWWNGVGAIAAIIAIFITVVGIILAIPAVQTPILSLFLKQKPAPTHYVYISPTPTKRVVATPTLIPTVGHTSQPTVVPSPSPVEVTVHQTMQQFCTYVYNGDEDGAFSILTSDARQSYYQGNVQKFWGDFGEYSGGSGTCNVKSCEVTSCNVTFSSQMHPSCQDSFTFVDTGKYTWRITGWSPLNNGCG